MTQTCELRRTALAGLSTLLMGVFCTLGVAEDSAPEVEPPGMEKSTKTQALEMGAKVLQSTAPLTGMDLYLVWFHPLKDKPAHQMEAHHFCRQVNEDFAQCVLFDGNTAAANLNGIEFIISEKLFAALPEDEKPYWHPHNYEILSGQLVAPGIPEVAEQALMRRKMNSYGKTWHVWNTGSVGQVAEQLPVGPARLAWSFNRDGEANPVLVERRDEILRINTQGVRQQRQELVPLAKPQAGVDALKGKFPGTTRPIPGVVETNAQEPSAGQPPAR